MPRGAGAPGPVQIDGRTAYVSGAASGIGRAMAQRLSAHGCPVAIVDVDEAGLAETAGLLRGPVLTRVLDVRDREAQFAFAREVAEWAPAPLGMVFNNAGVATTQPVADAVLEDDDWVLEINLGGVLHGTRAFLPILLRQGSGVVVNTSSVFGLVGIPTQSAYCTSKFAVRGFTESLRAELRGTGVRAVTVHPGGIKTNIARNSRFHSGPDGVPRTQDEAAQEFDAAGPDDTGTGGGDHPPRGQRRQEPCADRRGRLLPGRPRAPRPDPLRRRAGRAHRPQRAPARVRLGRKAHL